MCTSDYHDPSLSHNGNFANCLILLSDPMSSLEFWILVLGGSSVSSGCDKFRWFQCLIACPLFCFPGWILELWKTRNQ